jgi:hypothetical protein
VGAVGRDDQSVGIEGAGFAVREDRAGEVDKGRQAAADFDLIGGDARKDWGKRVGHVDIAVGSNRDVIEEGAFGQPVGERGDKRTVRRVVNPHLTGRAADDDQMAGAVHLHPERGRPTVGAGLGKDLDLAGGQVSAEDGAVGRAADVKDVARRVVGDAFGVDRIAGEFKNPRAGTRRRLVHRRGRLGGCGRSSRQDGQPDHQPQRPEPGQLATYLHRLSLLAARTVRHSAPRD